MSKNANKSKNPKPSTPRAASESTDSTPQPLHLSQPNDTSVQNTVSASQTSAAIECAVPPATSLPAAELFIDVVGDVFIETFLWPQGVEADLMQSLPYTWPDELRSSGATARFRELSGAPLHSKIYDSMLAVMAPITGALTPRWQVKSYPSFEECDKHTDTMDGGPFPVYLHELAPFSKSSFSNQPKERVWRISKSHGELRSNSPVGSHTARALASIESARTKTNTDTRKTLQASVTTWLKTLSSQPATILVINDRNALKENDNRTSVRASLKDIVLCLAEPRQESCELTGSQLRDQLSQTIDGLKLREAKKPLIIWQTRWELFNDDSIDMFLDSAGWMRSTIPIINYNCLREAGVPLRFDVSYETALTTLLDSLQRSDIDTTIGKCSRFPHVLIRYDNGVIHASFDVERKLVGLDIHGINAVGQTFETSEHGMMVGTTPLMVGALLAEALQAAAPSENAPFEKFLAETAIHPTILSPTRIDRAIDSGLILSSMHYLSGYGPVDSREWPLNLQQTLSVNGKERPCSASSYGSLFKSFLGLQAQKSSDERPSASPATTVPGAKSSDIESQSIPQVTLVINGDAMDKSFSGTRLARLSVGNHILGNSPDAEKLNREFSRVELLSDPKIIAARLDKDNAPRRWAESFQCVLRAIVERGMGNVARHQLQNMPGFRTEPSVFCPYVEIGSFVSIDRNEIDALLSIRNLVLRYVSTPNWSTPLAICVFGKAGSGKSYFVKQALSGIRGISFEKSTEFNPGIFTIHLRKKRPSRNFLRT